MRAGVGILSDGMSSRLFDRVREQRGLCYTVTASCHSMKNAGGVFRLRRNDTRTCPRNSGCHAA